MIPVTLKQLRYFGALARHGHFGRAADACAISQPALSMQVKELEDALGIALFEKGTRKVRLTSVGERVAARVEEILRAVDELGDLARASRDGLGGRLRIGVIPTVAPYLLPTVAQALAVSHPGLELRVRETVTARLLRELVEGRIDAAVLALPTGDASLAEEVLFTEEFLLVRPAADADRPVPESGDRLGAKLLLLEEGHCFRDQALRYCDMQSLQPRDLLDVSSLSTLVQMVGAGMGVTLIPEMAVAVETRSAPVSIARFPPPRPSRTVGMVWRRASPLGDQLARIAQVVRTAADSVRTVEDPTGSLLAIKN